MEQIMYRNIHYGRPHLRALVYNHYNVFAISMAYIKKANARALWSYLL